MSYSLDPTKTLRLDANWLREHATEAFEDWGDATEIKGEWSSWRPDRKFMNAVTTRQVGLGLPLLPQDLVSVSRSGMRYFLAVAIQHRLTLARLEVGAYRTSHVFVRTGQEPSEQTFKLMLEPPLSCSRGKEYAPAFFKTLKFSVLDTGILYCQRKKVYCILYDNYVLMAGPDDAIKDVKKELAKSFGVKAAANSFTYEGMHVNSADNGITIDCDEATKAFFAENGRYMDISECPTNYPVLREDVDMALRMEENDRESSKLSVLLNEEYTMLYRHILTNLGHVQACGRMDICAVRAYLGSMATFPRKMHWKMLQQLCQYLQSGPPYRLEYKSSEGNEEKPKGLNLCKTVRWFPVPIEVYAWFYGDCQITWNAKFEPLRLIRPGFEAQALRCALEEGAYLTKTVRELGLAPKSWQPEVSTLYSDVLGSPPCLASLADIAQTKRRGEPFTFAKAEDAEVDLGRTVEQNEAEKGRRLLIVYKYEGLTELGDEFF